MLFLMLTTLFNLIYKGIMLPICSHVINSGSVTIIFLIVLLTNFYIIPQKYISYDLSKITPL